MFQTIRTVRISDLHSGLGVQSESKENLGSKTGQHRAVCTVAAAECWWPGLESESSKLRLILIYPNWPRFRYYWIKLSVSKEKILDRVWREFEYFRSTVFTIEAFSRVPSAVNYRVCGGCSMAGAGGFLLKLRLSALLESSSRISPAISATTWQTLHSTIINIQL